MQTRAEFSGMSERKAVLYLYTYAENYEDIFQDLFFPVMLLLHKVCSKGIFNVKQKSQLMCDLIPVSQRQTKFLGIAP